MTSTRGTHPCQPQVLDLKFLHGASVPTLAVLYQARLGMRVSARLCCLA